MRYMDEFFRVGASGKMKTEQVAVATEPTDTAVIETVSTGNTTQGVTNEIDTITPEDSASQTPKSTTEEVTNQTPTVQPTVINQYPAYYPPGYAYPTVVLEDPTVKVETASVVSPNATRNEDKLKKMIMWLIFGAVLFLVYKQITKK